MAGKQRAFLVAQTIASIGYIVLLFMFCHLFGVLGAAFAYFGGQCLDVVLANSDLKGIFSAPFLAL